MRYYEASSKIASSPEAVWAVYSGPLLGLIWRSMPDLGPSFDRFAQGLKRRVEAGR
jgi:hypothetical protein